MKMAETIQDDDLQHWILRFTEDKKAAAIDYWYEILKGIDENLQEIEG